MVALREGDGAMDIPRKKKKMILSGCVIWAKIFTDLMGFGAEMENFWEESTVGKIYGLNGTILNLLRKKADIAH